MLMERSLIFVSNSKNRLSSTMFTLRTLLAPFRWWHIFIPIVPLNLMDVVEAPVPVLLGILNEQFITLNYEDLDNKMWVFIDDDMI
mmetsp:Transcript_31679/g.23481  ORF Transcript_31679/g.23481 Transcript_31679/m.23481 type:complete len:86 (-) Transcript_31679:86-343(-)